MGCVVKYFRNIKNRVFEMYFVVVFVILYVFIRVFNEVFELLELIWFGQQGDKFYYFFSYQSGYWRGRKNSVGVVLGMKNWLFIRIIGSVLNFLGI